MTYWNPDRETMDREAIAALQSERLRALVARVYDRQKPYRAKMDEMGIKPRDIRDISDLHKLPFTHKKDLNGNYPYGMFCVPPEEVVRVHASSGTTGRPTVVGYTAKDIHIWNECMARCLTMAGATKADVVHVAYGYGLFTGGLGGHNGGETIGATTIPASTGNTKRQLQLFEDLGSTVLLCTPSYAMHLGDAVAEAGLRDRLKLRIGVHGAEPWTDAMREQIEERLGIRCYDIYGLSEVMGPGVSCDCPARRGLHIMEDHFIPEVVDPATGKPLPDGQPGELVFTCLTKEALPLIRYNTHDITTLEHTVCDCGRTMVRMGKITGRTDDMLIIRGVNVFPSQVETVLLGIPEAAPYYVLVLERKGNLDTLEIQVEMRPDFEFDQVRKVERLEERIGREVLSVLGLSAKIRLLAPGTLARSEGKAKRIIDNRGI